MKRVRGRVWMLAVLVAAMVVALAANGGRFLVVDAPEPSDIIVVLAGETNYRPARGLELLRQGYARRMILDAPTAERVYNFSTMQFAERYVQGLPEAASIRICPIEGLSTRDEAQDVKKCLASEPGRRILLVTSDYHTRRALSIFRHEVHGKYFSMAAARDEAEFGTAWWTHREWAKTFLAEWQRLIWWNLVDRWR